MLPSAATGPRLPGVAPLSFLDWLESFKSGHSSRRNLPPSVLCWLFVFRTSCLLMFSSASLYPYCPLQLPPGDPLPVLINALPVVPFLDGLLVVPSSRPLPAPVAEDSMILTIPAPPHCHRPPCYYKLRDWRGRRFHCSVGGYRWGPQMRRRRLPPWLC